MLTFLLCESHELDNVFSEGEVFCKCKLSILLVSGDFRKTSEVNLIGGYIYVYLLMSNIINKYLNIALMHLALRENGVANLDFIYSF